MNNIIINKATHAPNIFTWKKMVYHSHIGCKTSITVYFTMCGDILLLSTHMHRISSFFPHSISLCIPCIWENIWRHPKFLYRSIWCPSSRKTTTTQKRIYLWMVSIHLKWKSNSWNHHDIYKTSKNFTGFFRLLS